MLLGLEQVPVLELEPESARERGLGPELGLELARALGQELARVLGRVQVRHSQQQLTH